MKLSESELEKKITAMKNTLQDEALLKCIGDGGAKLREKLLSMQHALLYLSQNRNENGDGDGDASITLTSTR